MVLVSRGQDRRHAERPGRMPRREAASITRHELRPEECVVEALPRGNIAWPLPARHQLRRKLQHLAVRVGSCRQQGCGFLVGVIPDCACRHQSHRHRGNLPHRDPLVEHIVDVVQVALMIAKIRHDMRVRLDHPSRACGHHQRRNPAVPLRKLRGRQPDVLLVAQNVRHKTPPRRLSLHWRSICFLHTCGCGGWRVRQRGRAVTLTTDAGMDIARVERPGSRRGAVRKTRIGRLRRSPKRYTPRARAQENTKETGVSRSLHRSYWMPGAYPEGTPAVRLQREFFSQAQSQKNRCRALLRIP